MSLFVRNSEFLNIETLLTPQRLKRPDHGIGDDAFLAKIGKEHWAISSDSSVEGIHFRLDWQKPALALEKAILSNLSDLNAMGAHCRYLILNLGAKPQWKKQEFAQLGKTLSRLEEKFGFQLAGGDTVKSSKLAFFSITVFGPVSKKPLLRSAAKPGHKIYVSGNLGASAAGLYLLSQKNQGSARLNQNQKHWIKSHFLPSPPLGLGPYLGSLKSSMAGIDISDGLSSELGHLASQSKVKLEIQLEDIPLAKGLKTAQPKKWKNWALNGGEEYQLLFTGNLSPQELEKARRICPISEIGSVKPGRGVFVKMGSTFKKLSAQGYSHL